MPRVFERIQGGLVGAVECLSRIHEGSIQGGPGFFAGLFELLQPGFRFGSISLHLFQRRIDAGAPLARDPDRRRLEFR